MKILFSNLPGWQEERGRLRQWIRAGSRWPFTRGAVHVPDEFRFGGYLPFPFFLSHAAGYTKRHIPDAEVTVRDSVARGESYGFFEDAVHDINPDWMVIESASPSIDHDIEVIQGLLSDRKVLLCGPIDEAKHQTILESNPNIHAILMGEYDKQVAKAIYGQSGVYRHELLTVEELRRNDFPFPIWDEECKDRYWDACPKGAITPQLQVWTSRSCPHKCLFCVFPAVMSSLDPDGTKPRKYKTHSPEWLEAYVQSRLTAHPYKSIYIDDDMMNLGDKHTNEVSGVMSKIGLPWSAMCRADSISREAWQKMRDSGCYGVKVGFESGDQYVLDHIVNKKLNLVEAEATCKWLRSIGMTVHTTWTVGLPGETPDQQRKTVETINRFYNEGVHDTHQLSGTSVISGTPLSAVERGEHLKKYDGAVVDQNYLSSGDGQKKIERLTR